MKSICKKNLITFSILVFAFLFMPISGHAAGHAKAKKAFRNFLGKSNITWSDEKFKSSVFDFRYYEIGKKKVPILVVSTGAASHAQGYLGVYQYLNGKVVRVAVYDNLESIYVKSGVLVFTHTGGGYGEVNRFYYRLDSKGKLKQFAYSAILDKKTWGKQYTWLRKMMGKDQYEWNGRKTSKTKFNSLLKKQVKGCKKKKLGTMYQNTAVNRNRYLK